MASIVIASVAVAVMCFTQLGLTLPVAGAVGVVTLALLMLIHKQMQKSAQIAQLKAELAQSRLAGRPKAGMRPGPAPQQAQAQPQSSQSATEARIRELSRDIGNLVPRSDASPAGAQGPTQSFVGPLAPEQGPRKAQRAPLPPIGEAAAKSASEAGAGPSLQGPTVKPPVSEPPADTQFMGPQPAQEDAPREQWSFRPRTDAQASVQGASAATNAMNGNAQAPVATTIEGDLELVQRKIKELADEVNAAEALRPKPQLVATRPSGPSSPLEDSIGALRAAAKSMRGRPSLGDFIPKFETQAAEPKPASQPQSMPAQPAAAPASPATGFGELVIPATAERIAGSDTAASASTAPPSNAAERDVAPPNLELPLPDFSLPSGPTLPPRADAISRAVDDGTIDVLLGPIVTLSEHSVSHYEMTANLVSLTGETLTFSEDDFALIEGDRDAKFDIARLTRAAALAARMDARDREGSLLAEFFGSSMTSRAFLETFANAYETRQRISAQLVLTFTQRAVDAFSPAAWQAVRDMHAFGFRFALDKVRHVGTDFAALQRSGFRFVRIDAQTLLNGLATPERLVPAEEILQRATLAGLSIIAAGIQDATTQKRLLDAGVLLGQGPLFGAPRQVNVDSGAGPSDQSAAA
ncbi:MULTISPECIES: EAL domain-containing protein [unclassified Hyphomicrobium]|uniref:EAL domain-containing protein n=1 Tax=unclassified Hyphomicrobium TaxID=2619925 RepID=UPI000319D575|nr:MULTISPECIES: EAL domain-containing protein [unclassified Hyphomicrobium]